MGSLLGGAMSAGESVADSDFVSENINKVTKLLILVLGVQAFIAYWRIRWFAYAGESALADIRKETFDREHYTRNFNNTRKQETVIDKTNIINF